VAKFVNQDGYHTCAASSDTAAHPHASDHFAHLVSIIYDVVLPSLTRGDFLQVGRLTDDFQAPEDRSYISGTDGRCA
jgi:hypothetical protein